MQSRPGGALALIALSSLTFQACIKPPPKPPRTGYGEPYQGTGSPIYVKDSRTDWEISEGGKIIPSERALEAVGDQEYETRRQLAKAYNDKLYGEGESHRTRGHIVIGAGIITMIAGAAIGVLLPKMMRDETITPATATDPEMRETKPGSNSQLAVYGGYAVVSLGGLFAFYGYTRGKKPPPYHRWRTPKALDRPAYVRQMTEPYNEKLGAPAVADQPGGVDVNEPLAPGQRRPPPPRPSGPGSKGGRR